MIVFIILDTMLLIIADCVNFPLFATTDSNYGYIMSKVVQIVVCLWNISLFQSACVYKQCWNMEPFRPVSFPAFQELNRCLPFGKTECVFYYKISFVVIFTRCFLAAYALKYELDAELDQSRSRIKTFFFSREAMPV